jgi:hypothetical protein
MDAEILELYDAELVDEDGRGYTARACGREREGGTWEAWIEFEREDGAILCTERETTQPNHDDAVYWATGITPVYLEGAFERAFELGAPRVAHAPLRPHDAFTERR